MRRKLLWLTGFVRSSAFNLIFITITIPLNGALSPTQSSPVLKFCHVGYTKLNKHTSHSGRMKVILLGLDLEKDSNHKNGFLMNTILRHKLLRHQSDITESCLPNYDSHTQIVCFHMQYCLSLLHNFIELSLNSGSAEVIILLAVCQRFAMVRFFDNGPYWK